MSATMLTMGNMNAPWGVCGFTSSFYAMWELEPGAHGRLINAPRPFSVLAEIKTYLRMLQAEGNTTAIKKIADFCRSFGPGFDKFTVEEYCKHVNESVGRTEDEIKRDFRFGIGIPPVYVADYLRRMWDYSSTVVQIPPGSDPGGDAIIGMVVKPGTQFPGNVTANTQYNLLVHYMYRRNGKIYSWGHTPYTSIEAAAAGGAA